MKWERLGRKVALDVALGLNYLHAQVNTLLLRVVPFVCCLLAVDVSNIVTAQE
jgi:hypothetical protein